MCGQARKTADAGDKAAAKRDEVKGKRQKALDAKRGTTSGAAATGAKPAKAGKTANKTATKAGKGAQAGKASTAGLPRLVIQADLTKIGRPSQKPKKKQAASGNKKPAARLH